MMPVFADTSYYLALLNPDDDAHRTASEFTELFRGIMVTSDWILTELADGLSGTKNRKVAIQFIETMRMDTAVRIVRLSRAQFDRGWNLFARRTDKEWSLTDCISFEVMRRMRLTDALTADHHFEQAGFRCLL